MDGSESNECPTCGGAGTVQEQVGSTRRLDGTYETRPRACPECGGSGMLISDDDVTAAKATLHAAITAYFQSVHPQDYVNGWSLVTHRRSPADEAAGISTVGVLKADGQDWPLTVGMLTVALDSERVQ